MEEGFVSLWLGNFKTSKDIENYVKGGYTEDGDFIYSKFQNDFLTGHYDEDFREIDFMDNQTSNIKELLEGFSYDDIIIPRFKEVCVDEINEEINAVILIYNYKYNGNIKSTEFNKNNLSFIATVEYK